MRYSVIIISVSARITASPLRLYLSTKFVTIHGLSDKFRRIDAWMMRHARYSCATLGDHDESLIYVYNYTVMGSVFKNHDIRDQSILNPSIFCVPTV